ncbi:unnamed protein product [Mycena citricolor]|uniref:Uncharacterized protein n=1 Tax=Mycena citricolor TaxID=2018698 RepID=A0AAD2HNQ6_9AGAR|nr:unnamed protein product [Mycena citricolor]
MRFTALFSVLAALVMLDVQAQTTPPDRSCLGHGDAVGCAEFCRSCCALFPNAAECESLSACKIDCQGL